MKLAPDFSVLVNEAKQPEVRLAKVKVNTKLTAPCETSILYPTDGGNMHCFTAVTACAVLDVLGPPYSDPDGRHCQYYLDFPFDNFSGTMVHLHKALYNSKCLQKRSDVCLGVI